MALRTLREFIRLESSSGILLFLAAVLALIFDNSPLSDFYKHLFSLPVVVQIGGFKLAKPLLLWVNDGLMAIFFFLVGLEIKREILEGELNSFSKSVLPVLGAIGGMLVPALIYSYLNWGDSVAMRGWAIPTATDIAFSLGICGLLGTRIPVSLKLFLTALAIFDDMGAIVIIAAYYTANISPMMLLLAMCFTGLLFLLNRFRVMNMGLYALLGILLWVCVLKSGVHATLAGIIAAMAIPMRDPKHPRESPLRRIESKLHPWVAFGVLPIFAFANAGISFSGFTLEQMLNPITLGIVAGLLLGKQVGITFFSWLGIKTGIAKMPTGTTMLGLYGVSLIAGVGFTMSLFIGSLAFGHQDVHHAMIVRLGVIVGSLLAGLMGYLILRYGHPRGGQSTH